MTRFLAPHFYRKPILYFGLALLLGALLIALISPAVAQGPDQTAYILPANPQIVLGGFGTTDIWLEDVDRLHSFQISLSYDPNMVKIIDNDPVTSALDILNSSNGTGVGSLLQGRMFTPGPVLSSTGIITISAALLGAQEPISGTGSLVSITWQGLQETNNSAITLTSLQLLDRNGQRINSSQQSASVQLMVYRVQPIIGTINLQGRFSGLFNNTQIFLSNQPCPPNEIFPPQGLPAAITDAEGKFTIIPTPGQIPHCLQAVQPGYLTSQIDLTLGRSDINLNLLGGDIDGNRAIDITDISVITRSIGVNDPDLRADINADHQIDISDLTIAAGNFK